MRRARPNQYLKGMPEPSPERITNCNAMRSANLKDLAALHLVAIDGQR
jgi:hypothetical protein